MTFSIVAFDPASRSWGVAVASKCLAVGFAVPWGGAEVGAIATQALANLSYGPNGLELAAQRARRHRDGRSADRRRPAGRPASARRRRRRRAHRQPHRAAVHGLEGSSSRRALHRRRATCSTGRRSSTRWPRRTTRRRRTSGDACCSASRPARRPVAIVAASSRRRCRSGRKARPTAAVSTSGPTCASTTTSRRSPSSAGCSICTSSTSSVPTRRRCCRSRVRWPDEVTDALVAVGYPPSDSRQPRRRLRRVVGGQQLRGAHAARPARSDRLGDPAGAGRHCVPRPRRP